MTNERLTDFLAARVMGWRVGPDRFLLGDRRWIPRWRFQPMTRIEDALDLVAMAKAQTYTIGADTGGEFRATAIIAGVVGVATDASQARALTLAALRALRLEVEL